VAGRAVLGRVGQRWGDLLTAATIGLVALGVYVHTLLPGLGGKGDTAKWQTISAVGGVPHATGYPLYVAAVQAWARLVPVATFAYRTNLFSAVAGAAAIAVLHGLLRTVGLRPAVAAAAALTFAFTPTFWSQAVIAEVYTLHILFVVSILACLAKWRTGGSNRWLLAGLALLALSFGNHMSTALLLPAVAWLALSDRRRALTRANVLLALAFAVIGACQYLYLFRMSAVGGYVEWRIDGLDDVWRLATGQQFRKHMWAFGPGSLVADRVPLLWRLLRAEYGVLLELAVVGLVAALLLVRRRRPIEARGHVLVAVGLVGLASAVYGLEYDVVDVYVFFLPLYLALAVAIGVALDAVVGWVTGGIEPPLRRASAVVVVGGLLLLCPVKMVRAAYEPASQRGNVTEAYRINYAVDEAGEHAVFLADGYHDVQYLNYFLRAEGWGRRHHLSIVYWPSPQAVEDYFATGLGPVGPAANAVGAPPGGTRPRLLMISERGADAMAEAGLTVTPYADGMWEIGPP
jgi:hypothetical protein